MMTHPETLQKLADGTYLATIPSGQLKLRMLREDLPLGDALDFAARNNVKRQFLFVSRLLGRHLPTPPARIRAGAAALAAKLHAAGLEEPIVFIGMAETATTLGQAVYREWTRLGGRGLYLDTTRRDTGGRVAMAFTEAHSHAPSHIIYQPGPAEDPGGLFDSARTLVVVDDEMTTGRTAANLAAAFRERLGHEVDAHIAVLVRWLAPEEPASTLTVHTLLEGEFEFIPDPAFTPAALPVTTDDSAPALSPQGSRHGMSQPQTCPWPDAMAERVLVVGTGEFGFVPLLLAEQVEAAGGQAFVQNTTRSPVALGGAVGHARHFPALSGEGYTEFLYNVPDDHVYDRVILCCEDRLPAPGHPILQLPRIECRLAK